MKKRALVLATLLLLALLPAVLPATADMDEDRSPGLIRVKLYAQLSARDTSLSTQQSRQAVETTNSIDFTSAELQENLVVVGVGMGVGQNKGFNVRISVQPITQATVTIQVRDNDAIVANRSIIVAPLETRTDWQLPFTSSKDTYTFSKRHTITLRVSANTNVFVRTTTDSYLELHCQDHLDISAETRDIDYVKTSSFYPNDLLDQRAVNVTGEVINPFGQGDIGGVNVSIRRPDGQYAIRDEAAEIEEGMEFWYEWAYASGLPSGTYTLNVTGRDEQGHEFTMVTSFMMAEYGVRMSAEDEEAGVIQGSTTPGTPAKYTLTILNIGGKSANIAMTSTDPPLLWASSFSKTNFNLGAGNDEDVTFDVKPGSSIGGGNATTLTVTATVENDPSIPKAKDFLQVETSVRDDVEFVISPEKPDPKTVGVGGTVEHVFTLRNVGEYKTTVDLTTAGVPQGWTAVFIVRGESVTFIDELRPMEIVDIVLRVTAPTTSDARKASIKVTCKSREYPEAEKSVTFETKMVIGLVLTPKTDLTTTQDPDTSFVIYFEAFNNDPTSSHDVAFSVEQKTSTWPSSTSFRFTPYNQYRLSPESKADLGLQVNVPENAAAGSFRFTIKGVVDNNNLVSAQFDFNVTISVRHQIDVDLDLTASQVEIGTKEASLLFLTITNSGNVQETVNVTVELSGEDIEVMIDGIRTSKDVAVLEPGESTELKIGFQAKDTASNNERMTVRITVMRKGDPTPITPNDFELVVKKSNSEIFLDFVSQFWIMIILLFAMVYLMVYRPRSRRPPKTKEEGDEDAEAHHGTMVKT